MYTVSFNLKIILPALNVLLLYIKKIFFFVKSFFEKLRIESRSAKNTQALHIYIFYTVHFDSNRYYTDAN